MRQRKAPNEGIDKIIFRRIIKLTSQYNNMEISANNLFFNTIKKPIAKGISFSCPIGQKTAIYGPESSGKKVLLLMLGGFLKPSSGSVSFNDRNISKDLEGYRKNVGLGETDEVNPLSEEFTVRENLEMCMELSGCRRQKEEVEKILQRFNLKTYRETRISQCDPLTRSLASLACVACNQPEIIILDEPTKRLSSHQAEKFWKICNGSLAGKTLIFSTKNFSEAKSNADKIITIENGYLVKE